jgi:hypothetical protein
VFGVRSGRAEARLREVYASTIEAGTPVVVTDYPTAELVKVSANAFLSTKISFINAMAEVCEAAGADVLKLSESLGYDDRIGRKFLGAGLGFGGGCLPKDIRAFMARAGELGADQALTFLREVDAINMRRRAKMVDLAREQCGGGFLGRRIAVLGAAFKPDSDDIRDSPALNVAAQIQLQGGQVTVYDPKALDNARKMYPHLSYAESAAEAAEGAHVVLHLTEWREFREIDPAEFGGLVAERRILDGRVPESGVRCRAWLPTASPTTRTRTPPGRSSPPPGTPGPWWVFPPTPRVPRSVSPAPFSASASGSCPCTRRRRRCTANGATPRWRTSRSRWTWSTCSSTRPWPGGSPTRRWRPGPRRCGSSSG